jgi:small subunit ribosomal protein S3
MGQKVQPIGFRTGITRGWMSTWYALKSSYGDFLVEDQKIRAYVDKRFNRQPPFAAVSKAEIARTRNEVKVTLYTARPGMVIGPRGAEVDKFREELEELVDRKISINVIEIKEPSLDAKLIGEAISEQLRKRAAFRRVMKQQCEEAMEAGAKGVKILCSGRLGGAEIARTEGQKLGSIPLHTLDANVEYAASTAFTTYGAVGIKVWIYKGKFGEEIAPRERTARPARRGGGGGGRGGAGGGGRGRSSGPRRDSRTGGSQQSPPSGGAAPAAPATE